MRQDQSELDDVDDVESEHEDVAAFALPFALALPFGLGFPKPTAFALAFAFALALGGASSSTSVSGRPAGASIVETIAHMTKRSGFAGSSIGSDMCFHWRGNSSALVHHQNKLCKHFRSSVGSSGGHGKKRLHAVTEFFR